MIEREKYLEIERLINNGPSEFNSEQIKKIKNDAVIFERMLYNDVMQGNFDMFYQPKVEDDCVTMKNAEALFRTKAPYFINPEIAFTLFKAAGHEKDVLNKQIEKICCDTKTLSNEFGEDFRVSINVALNLLDENFFRNIDYQLKNSGLSYKNIEIEILENENFKNVKDHSNIINFLKSKGVKFALDDYGSKNANKNALRTMNFDVVKIDKGIINNARKNNDYCEIEEIYNNLKLENKNVTIVVEGVEDKNDVKNLKQIGKMTYQGYYFSKPVPVNDVINTFGAKSLNR